MLGVGDRLAAGRGSGGTGKREHVLGEWRVRCLWIGARAPRRCLPSRVGSSLSEQSGSLAAAAAAKSLQSCPTLCDPIDSSPLGSPVPGILQARALEWVAISFSNA